MVDIAELVKAPDCGSGDRGFESHYSPHAGVAELADALDLGSSVYDVGVQVLFPAPLIRTQSNIFSWTVFFCSRI